MQVCINNALCKVFAKRKEELIENFTFALSNNPNHRFWEKKIEFLLLHKRVKD